MSNLNIVIRSYIEIYDLILPIKIDIADIKDDGQIFIDDFIISDIVTTKENVKYMLDKTETPFINAYKFDKIKDIIRKIWKFVDKDLETSIENNIINLLNIQTYDDFEFFMLRFDLISYEDIKRIIDIIIYYEANIKYRFIEEAKNLLELDKEYPNIPLKKDEFSSFIEKYNEYYKYNYTMTSLQSVSEYPMDIWFPENVGKAYFDWSWREQEMKRMYVTAKHIKDGFKDTVKAKAMELSRESSSNKQSTPKARGGR
jgi:hypothetical protein